MKKIQAIEALRIEFDALDATVHDGFVSLRQQAYYSAIMNTGLAKIIKIIEQIEDEPGETYEQFELYCASCKNYAAVTTHQKQIFAKFGYDEGASLPCYDCGKSNGHSRILQKRLKRPDDSMIQRII